MRIFSKGIFRLTLQLLSLGLLYCTIRDLLQPGRTLDTADLTYIILYLIVVVYGVWARSCVGMYFEAVGYIVFFSYVIYLSWVGHKMSEIDPSYHRLNYYYISMGVVIFLILMTYYISCVCLSVMDNKRSDEVACESTSLR